MAIALTLAVHGLGLVVLSLFGFKALFAPGGPAATKVEPVGLRALPQSQWADNRQVNPRKNPAASPSEKQPPQQPPEPEKKEREALPKGKVVDVAPGNGEKPPDDTAFLAERNNRVDKQTVSKDTTLNYRNAAPKPSTTAKGNESAGGHDAVEKKVVAGNGGIGHDDAPRKDGKKKGALEIPSAEKRDELALKADGAGGHLRNQGPSDEVRGNSHRLLIRPGGEQGEDGESSQGKAGDETRLNLTPSAAVLDKILGAPAADVSKHFDDLEEGDGTYLNTREFKYSSFFNRVKQHVVLFWNPNELIRQRDPRGEIYLYKDRYTVVTVTLDRTGSLKDIAVDKSSGVDFLDSEAVSAFRRAHRFPNPPPGLTDGRGEIRFNFAFGIYNERGFMQLFRPN